MNKLSALLTFVLVAAAAAGEPPAPPGPAPASSAAPSVASEPADRSPLAGWRRVQLGASKFLLGSARSTVERWPAGEGADEALVRVTTNSNVIGRSSRLRDAFSTRADGEFARWMEYEPGRKAREAVVDGNGELVTRRFAPPDGQRPPWNGPWSEGHIERTPVKRTVEGGVCASPVDPWALLANLRCLVGAEEVRFVLLSKTGGHEVVARRMGRRQSRVTLSALDEGKRRAVTMNQVRVDLSPAPGEPGPSLFGLDGNITLWIDEESGAPVEISGRLEKIHGTVRFRLQGFSATPRPRPEVPWPSAAKNALAGPPA